MPVVQAATLASSTSCVIDTMEWKYYWRADIDFIAVQSLSERMGTRSGKGEADRRSCASQRKVSTEYC